MYKIGLINMPFASVQLPSIALTQLKSVTQKVLTDRIHVEIFYLNHDFAQFFGIENYWMIANSLKSTVSGLGDWFFRQAAFPDAVDNTEAYASRFLRQFENREEVTLLLKEKRQMLDSFFDHLTSKYSLETCSLVGFTSMFSQNTASLPWRANLKQEIQR